MEKGEMNGCKTKRTFNVLGILTL